MKIYCVGGAIRDELLGLPVKDRDWVVVGATPGMLLSEGYKPVVGGLNIYQGRSDNVVVQDLFLASGQTLGLKNPDGTGKLGSANIALDHCILQDGNSDVWASLADASRAYDTLNQTDKLLLKLRLGAELRFAEIAEELDLPSPDAARMRVNRALARVAERASDGSARWTARMDFANKGSDQ